MDNRYSDSELKTIDKCKRISDSFSEQFLNIKIKSLIEKIEYGKGVKIEIKKPFREYLLNKYCECRLDDKTVEKYLGEPLNQILENGSIRQGDRIIIEDEPVESDIIFKYYVENGSSKTT